MQEFLKIPNARIGALIGPNGEVKKDIEGKGKVEISIDSETGEVEVSSEYVSVEALKALDVVKAIGRGFSPERAIVLFKEGYRLEILEIEEYAGKTGNLSRVRARIIGSNGRMRENIEKETGCFVSVYGKTVSVIGKDEKMNIAVKAIEMLLGGARHSSAYNYLYKALDLEGPTRLEL